jgi:hypothetical protein
VAAVVAERVGYARRGSDECAGRDGDRLGLAPDLEGQFTVEDIKRICVPVMNVRFCNAFARCTPGVRDREFLACEQDADLRLSLSRIRSPSLSVTLTNPSSALAIAVMAPE